MSRAAFGCLFASLLPLLPAAAAFGAPLPQATSPASQPDQAPATPPISSEPPASQPESVFAQQQRQLQVFRPVLLNASTDIDAETRRNAAIELLGMEIPEAREALAEALRSRKPAVVMAVLAAMQAAAALPEPLLQPAVQALAASPAEGLAVIASILARYGEPAATLVAEIALNTGSPATARFNAVTALGSFRHRDAAAALMRILETTPPPTAPLLEGSASELRRTAIASLERMTGLGYGSDLAAWRTWWAKAADESDEQWFRLISDSLAGRVAALQQHLQEQRQANDRTSRELFATYRDLYPVLPIEEQLRRLPKLLSDKLAPVREFGLSRVAVLARDAVRIPAETVDLVRARLNDEMPELRVMAAELLDEVNDERAADAIAARLNVETSPQVIAGMLSVLSRRPTPAGMNAALRLLASETSADQAAEALWQMLQGPLGAPANIAQAREAARAAARRLTPSTLRLAAFVCEDRDVADLTALLDDQDDARSAAVAEAFWRRGLRQPLLDRAADETIYPFAIRALADGPADLASFGVLAALRPPEAHRRLWGEMVLRLASRLPVEQSLAADDALRSLAYADVALRRDLLLQAASSQRDAMAAGVRLKIVERLAPMLIDLSEFTRAYELLEALNGAASAPTLRVVRFQAAALTAHYDLAAQVQPDPAEWVSLLEREFDRVNPACARLHDEIVRRFASALTAEQSRRLQQIAQAIEAGEQRG